MKKQLLTLALAMLAGGTLTSCQQEAEFFEKDIFSLDRALKDQDNLPGSPDEDGEIAEENESGDTSLTPEEEPEVVVIVPNQDSPKEEESNDEGEASKDETPDKNPVTHPGDEVADNNQGGDDGKNPGDSGEEVADNNQDGDDSKNPGDSGEEVADNNQDGEDGTNPGDNGDEVADNNQDGENSTNPEGEDQLGNASDLFVQKGEMESAKLDIIWVIDNSGSMKDNQEALAQNFEMFINTFADRNLDYRMGITTTDVSKNDGQCKHYGDYCELNGIDGRMVNPIEALTSERAQYDRAGFIDDFKHYAKVGTKGSGTEIGLEGMKRFSQRYRKSFFREDAYTIVIIVSDEDNTSKADVQSFIAPVQNIKKNKGLLKIHSVVSLQTVKKNYRLQQVQGMRYIEASEKTNGLVADIEDNFANVLSDIGEEIVHLSESFALGSVPYQGDLEVIVDGNEVSLDAYEYFVDSNTIKFQDGFIPLQGSEIVVKYNIQK